MRAFYTWLLLVFTALAGGELIATSPAAASPVEEVSAEQCRNLAALDLSELTDAPTKILRSQPMPATKARPALCQVSGYVHRSVHFVLALPSAQWNGKFLQLGCGGYCGSLEPTSTIPFDCDDALRRGYACIFSDGGHSGVDALWAYDNLPAEVDNAFRAVHVTALAGKAVVEHYYGRTPRRSYFMGASNGGRLALNAAQRFPWDFDGIVAGVPSLSWATLLMNLLWGHRAVLDQAGDRLLAQADLEVLYQGMLAECDLNDGLKDGLIGDPRACSFNPRQLLCRAGRTVNCLTGRQIEAVERIYKGPVDSQGRTLCMPGALRGSERSWLMWFSTLRSEDPHGTYNFLREIFRYAAFDPDPGPAWRPESFDFDRDPKRFGVAEALGSALNPDLRQFKAAGGKLIAFAGWSDAAAVPLQMVDYYEAAERVSGGRAATQQFFRLFMVPGMDHAFGQGTFAADWLGYVDAWVEKGEPPDEVISARLDMKGLDERKPEDYLELFRRSMAHPLNLREILFSRPIYPYPTLSRYRGHGDPREASSFAPVLLQAAVAGE